MFRFVKIVKHSTVFFFILLLQNNILQLFMMFNFKERDIGVVNTINTSKL